MQTVNPEDHMSDQEYLIYTAKKYKTSDQAAAKAWMLTAKSLFPHDFSIQREAYLMISESENIKEAALCLEEMTKYFGNEPLLWSEMQRITEALRSDSKDKDVSNLKELFSYLSREVQHKLLLSVADHSEDTMEHCQLMLLLLHIFPDKIAHHGVKLIDTLFTAEKHGPQDSPVNNFRQLLVTEVMPVILASHDIDIPPKQIFRLLQKSIEFYISYIYQPSSKNQIQNPGILHTGGLPFKASGNLQDPWEQLYSLLEATGRKLDWELADLFSTSGTDDARWQRIVSFIHKRGLLQGGYDAPGGPGTHALVDEYNHAQNRQVFFFVVVVFLHSLYNFGKCLNHDWLSGNGVNQGCPEFVLVEGTEHCLGSDTTWNSDQPRLKKRKLDDEGTEDGPSLTVSRNASVEVVTTLTQSFIVSARCWEILQRNAQLKKEFSRLSQHIHLEELLWFQEFYIDSLLYQGLHEEAIRHIAHLQKMTQEIHIKNKLNLQLATCFWASDNIPTACEYLLDVICSLPDSGAQLVNKNSFSLQQKKTGRSLHFLHLQQAEVLDYCIRMLIYCLKEKALATQPIDDLLLGNFLVLLQYDWPYHEALFLRTLDAIKEEGNFSYKLFFNYIINPDMLEEFMYLTTTAGGTVNLDLVASSNSQVGKQRAVTRGVNKGVKEELKTAMEKQMGRCDESLEQLLLSYFRQERELLKQNLQ